jgi:hypothetical protein
MRKILVLGHARHGKDTAADYLAEKLGLTYAGSSEVCCDAFIFDAIKDKYNYNTALECFEDRVNHRIEWHNLIAEYCKDDKAKLGRLIFEWNDIYCGVRAVAECEAVIAELDPIVIWINAMSRVAPEPESSMQLKYKDSWIKVQNNGTGGEFLAELDKLVEVLKYG